MLQLNEIKIINIIRSTKAISSEDGVMVYKKVKELYQPDSYVEISFGGITLVTTAFLTSLIENLLRTFPQKKFSIHIKFKEVDPQMRPIIDMVIKRSHEYSSDSKGFKELAERIIHEP